MTKITSFSPLWVSPPGDTIADLLEEYHWSKEQLAERLGYKAEEIDQLIDGKLAITIEIAQMLAKVLGSTTEFWLMRENQYRTSLAKIEKKKVITINYN